MVPVAAWLRKAGAHHDVVQWAEGFGDDWQGAWEQCPRGDWLLGMAARLEVERHYLVEGACRCARLALLYVPEEERRPEQALATAEAWCQRRAETLECWEQKAQVASLGREAADDPAMQAATSATIAALDAIEEPDAAAAAAACAIQAAVLDAGDCAMMAALRFTQQRCAQLVRESIPDWHVLERARALRALSTPPHA